MAVCVAGGQTKGIADGMYEKEGGREGLQLRLACEKYRRRERSGVAAKKKGKRKK